MEDKQNEKFRTTTSVWNENIENVLKEIQKHCENYKFMNIESASKSAFKHSIAINLLITGGSIAGILSSLATIYEDYSQGLQIVVTVFSFVISTISSIIKFSKFEQKTSSHKTMATKYASLEGNIRRQLSLDRQDRVNAGEYLEWISNSFNDLFDSTPLMSDEIYKNFKNETSHIEVVTKDEKSIVPNLTQYTDTQMKYQMRRLNAT